MKSIELTTCSFLRRPPALAAALFFAVGAAYAADYPSTITNDNPVVYYRFEDSTNLGLPTYASNSSPSDPNQALQGTYNYNGENTSPLLGLPGIDTNSILFTGGGSDYGYVDLPNSAGLTSSGGASGGPFSFEMWVQPQANPGSGEWSIPFEVAQYPNGWNIYVSGAASGSPSYFYLDMRPPVFSGVPAVPITFFQWYHLVATFDGTNANFYIDGTNYGPYNASGFAPATGSDGHIGSGQGAGWEPFVGGVDEVAFYTNVLTPAQVLTHYQVGTNSFSAPPTAASVATAPVSITNFSGTTASFSVTAQGTRPLIYQWYTNSTLVAGATDSTYSLLAEYPTDTNLQVSVLVSNSYGGQVSAPAVLTVLNTLNIISPPGSIARNVGSYAAFHVTADGALPIGYQWSASPDGNIFTNITGATNDTLWVTNVQLSQNNYYYTVVVTNPFNTVSETANLNVQPRSDPAVPLTGYGAIIAADKPVAYWRLDETSGSLAEDAVGTFDGTYTPGAGTVIYGAPSGIPHTTDSAVILSNGAAIQVPWAPELNPDTAWSVETWVQPSSLAANQGDYRIVLSSEYNQYPTLYGWYIYQQPANNFIFVPQPANAFIIAGPNDPATTNQLVAGDWYHLVVTDDTTNFTVYVNGQAIAGAPLASVPFTPDGDGINAIGTAAIGGLDDGNFVIGQRTDAQFGTFEGTIDDTAVYNYALSPQQIASHYNSAALGPALAKSVGGAVTLTWSVGVLQESGTVNGLYTNVIGANSPYTLTYGGNAGFFRLHVP
ncbi:MAG TPA: LamG domain-containing protein [Verrucomicrobiae bacterium]|jgi:hypothetical protein|nr:LamG domain-containing protein [Verrucomicrobiae bacterium]